MGQAMSAPETCAGAPPPDVTDWLDQFYTSEMGRDEPLALAVSGGADSMAMLHMVLCWAALRRRSGKVYAIIIDHALRAGSDIEAKLTAKRVRDMGARAIIRTWKHSGVSSAIQERARHARYDLLARSCYDIGAARLLVGHTQDDQAETIAMRQRSGASWRGLAGISDNIHAPLWPQTRHLTIGRPLLSLSREQTRAYCQKNAIAFVDDPSNEDTDYQRVRIRQALMGDTARRQSLLALGQEMRQRREKEARAVTSWLSREVTLTDYGRAEFTQCALSDMPLPALADVARIIGGQSYRADMAQVQALRDHIAVPDFAARTLGGSLFYASADDEVISVVRDLGGVLGRRDKAAAKLELTSNQLAVWDGRFEVETCLSGLHMAALWPARGQLNKPAKQRLSAIAAPARRTLPAFFKGDALLAAPHLGFYAASKSEFYLSYIGFMRF